MDSIGVTCGCTRKKLVWSFFLVHLWVMPIASVGGSFCEGCKGVSYGFCGFVPININSELLLYIGAFVSFLPVWSGAEIKCTVHVALPNWPIN